MIALMLAEEVADLGDFVVGPFDKAKDAAHALEAGAIDAAIVDANLLDRDITPVAQSLFARAIPFVIYSGTGLPPGLAHARPEITVVMKPGLPIPALLALLDHKHAVNPLGAVHRDAGNAIQPARGD